MTTFTDGPAAGQTLMLQRSPVFLRVVYAPPKWDALDLFEDTPGEDETIYVYYRDGEATNAFIDFARGAKRRSGLYSCATYNFYSDQPPEEVMRSTEAWREWCQAQVGVLK